jgi:hypothetical protein
LFSLSDPNTILHALLAFKVSVEKSAVTFLWVLCCYIKHKSGFTFTCYLIFVSYSLQCCFLVLCDNCFNDNMAWRGSILVVSVSCSGGSLYLIGHLFLDIWEIFAIILLNILCIPLVWTYSPSSMPMMCRFGL